MTEPTRAQALMDEFKTGLNQDGPVVLAERVAQLELERDAALARINDDVIENGRAIDGLTAELEIVRAELVDAKTRAERAEAGEKTAKGEVRKLTTPARPRKLGAIGKFLTGEELRDAIADAGEAVIAFSDGTREIAGIAPVAVSGDAWREHVNGLLLDKRVDIEGSGEAGGTSVTIDGYALLIDGKQVAYSRRSTPIQVAPGQQVSISDDIIF